MWLVTNGGGSLDPKVSSASDGKAKPGPLKKDYSPSVMSGGLEMTAAITDNESSSGLDSMELRAFRNDRHRCKS